MRRPASTHERLAERLANILTKLNVGYQLSVTELAQEFHVSTRTIERDFDRLNSYLPLIQDDSSKKYSLDPVYLGRFKLQDIQNFAQISGISELYPSLDMSFLRGLLDERASQVFSAKGYYFENAEPFLAHFQVLAEVIYQRKEINFIYNDRLRSVHPYRLIHYQGHWYLAASNDGELRAYRLSKIDNVTQHVTIQFEHDPEILAQLEGNEGIWFGKNQQEVLVSVRPEVALYFKQRHLFPEQKIEAEDATGALLIRCQIRHEMQLLPLVRYWMPYIKIIQPTHLQEKLEQDFRQYLATSVLA